MKIKKKLPFHYAWVIMLCGVLISGAGSGVFISALGVFVKPVCQAFQFERAAFMLYSTLFFITNVVLMPFYGFLLEKFGFRRVAGVSSVMCTLALLGYSVSTRLWHFYACAILSGLFVNGLSAMAVGVLVNQWFADKQGFASGVAFSGSGLLAAVLIPVLTRLLASHGAAWTYRFLAVIELCITLPVILFVIRDAPEQIGLTPYRSGGPVHKLTQDAQGMNYAQALRTPCFWLLLIAIMGIAVGQAGPNSNTVSILDDTGYSPEYAARVSSVYMVLLTVSKIGMGFVFDSIGALGGTLVIAICGILFPIAALFNHLPGVPWLYVSLLAVAGTGSTVLGAVLTSRYFGRKDYARIYSVIALGTQLGAAVSSPFLGYVYDRTGGYDTAWYALIGLEILVTLCLLASYRAGRGKMEAIK